jgi:hypothetical protein
MAADGRRLPMNLNSQSVSAKPSLKFLLASWLSTDRSKSPFSRFLQLLSRFSWELLQQCVGFGTAVLMYGLGLIESMQFHKGVLFLEVPKMGRAGFCIGSMVTIGHASDEKLRSHEFGHYIQGRIWGPLWIFLFGLPSLLRAAVLKWLWKHGKAKDVVYDRFYTESHASRLGRRYY